MNKPSDQPMIDPELEARIVALVLGEASDFEREQLGRLIAERPELAAFKKRMESVHGLLGDVATGEPAPRDDDWKLSVEHHKTVLAVLSGELDEAALESAGTLSVASRLESRRSGIWKLTSIAATLGLAVLLAGITYSGLLSTQVARRATARLDVLDESETSAKQRGLMSKSLDSAVSGPASSVNRYYLQDDVQFFNGHTRSDFAVDLEGMDMGGMDDAQQGDGSGATRANASTEALSQIRDSLALNMTAPRAAGVVDAIDDGATASPVQQWTFGDMEVDDAGTVDFTIEGRRSGSSRFSSGGDKAGEREERFQRQVQSPQQSAATGVAGQSQSFTAPDGELSAGVQLQLGKTLDRPMVDEDANGYSSFSADGQMRGKYEDLYAMDGSADLGGYGRASGIDGGMMGGAMFGNGGGDMGGGTGGMGGYGGGMGGDSSGMAADPFARDAEVPEGEPGEGSSNRSEDSIEVDEVSDLALTIPSVEMSTPQILFEAERGRGVSEFNKELAEAKGLSHFDEYRPSLDPLSDADGDAAYDLPQSGPVARTAVDRSIQGLEAGGSVRLREREAAPWGTQVNGPVDETAPIAEKSVANEPTPSIATANSSEKQLPDAAKSSVDKKVASRAEDLLGKIAQLSDPQQATLGDALDFDAERDFETKQAEPRSKGRQSSEALGLERGRLKAEDQKSWFGYVPPKLHAGFESIEAKSAIKKKAAAAGLNEQAASEQSFSTFSLHVSDVSFKLAWSALSQGEWPEAARIRIEEFVNAFDYGDPMPTTSEKIACRIEQCVHPFLQQRNLLRVSLRTAAEGRASQTPLRLTLLLDNSGSMERVDRRETVRRAFATLASQLKPIDRVTLIGFARRPRLLADQVSGAETGQLVRMISEMPSEGGTNIEAALQLAFEKAREQQVADAQNRIILLTDGAVNLGNANPESLSRMITTIRDAGIAFDAAGISAEGLNDEILEALTRKGDGRYYLLDYPENADDGFAQQIAGALRPSAKNVKVQVEFNPQRVGRYKLLGFEKHRLNKEDFRNDQVDAAEMAAEEAGVAVYQFEAKPEGVGDIGTLWVRFRDMSSGKMVERSWPIPYQPDAPRADQAAGPLRIAASAALFAAKLKGDPLGESVDLKSLADLIAGLPSQDRRAARVDQLNQMIQQARQLTGN